jgi:hypothetical protein
MALKRIRNGLAITAGLIGLAFFTEYVHETLNPYQQPSQKMIVETLDDLEYDSLEEVVEEQALNFNDLEEVAQYLRKNSPFKTITAENVAYLTRLANGEAGGEIQEGREAIPWVIINRLHFNIEEYLRFGDGNSGKSTERCVDKNVESCDDLTDGLMSIVTGRKARAEFDALRINGGAFFTPESFKDNSGNVTLYTNNDSRKTKERLDLCLYSVVNVLLGNVKDPTIETSRDERSKGALFYLNKEIATSKNPPRDGADIGKCTPENSKVCEQEDEQGVCTREKIRGIEYIMVPSRVIGNHDFYTSKRVLRETVISRGNKTETYLNGDLARECQPRRNKMFCEHYRNGRVDMTSLTDKSLTGKVRWRKYDRRGRVTNRCTQERGNKNQCQRYQDNVRRF